MSPLAISRYARHPGRSLFWCHRHHGAKVTGVSEVTSEMFPFRTSPDPAVCFYTTPRFSAHVQFVELLLFHSTVNAKPVQ